MTLQYIAERIEQVERTSNIPDLRQALERLRLDIEMVLLKEKELARV